MRKFSFVLALVAIFSLGFAGTASAGLHQCPDGSWHMNCGNYQLPDPPVEPEPVVPGNTNTNTATGGSGGDSSARAYGGDGGSGFSSSLAGGGDASSSTGPVTVGPVRSGSDSSVGPVGNNSGNSPVTFGNGLDNFSPDANAYSGVDFEDARFGNSRSGSQAGASADSTNNLSNNQGQATDVNVGTRVGTAVDTTVGNELSQGMATDNDQELKVAIDASDNRSTVIEDSRDPVASAATVFASACSAGVSAQSYGFGGALATVNPMCDLALAAEMAKKLGTEAGDELATKIVNEAVRFALARVNPMRRHAQWIPFIGQLF